VQTNEGAAVVIRILGRTSGGGRLLELSMDDGRKDPFFAGSANVMVRPLENADLDASWETATGPRPEVEQIGRSEAEHRGLQEPWLGA
jgi:hypothetical protein